MKYEILRAENICKRMDQTDILKNVSIEVYTGEVHVLEGDCGSGKSMLMQILAGLAPKDSGRIYYEGNELCGLSTDQIIDLGISILRQETQLAPRLSIADNLFLGREIRSDFGFCNKKLHRQLAQEMLREVGLDLCAGDLVMGLTPQQQRLVELLRAANSTHKLILLDEPMNVLFSNKDLQILAAIFNRMIAQGSSILCAARNANGFLELVDRITYIRSGEITYKQSASSLGRAPAVQRVFPSRQEQPRHFSDSLFLRISSLETKQLKNLSFDVRGGEALGVVSLNAGEYLELAKALFGLIKIQRGGIQLQGVDFLPKNPRHAMKHGVSLILNGPFGPCFPGLGLEDNITMASLKKASQGPFVHPTKQRILIKELERILPFDFEPGGFGEYRKFQLSLARSLLTRPKLLILCDTLYGLQAEEKQRACEDLLILKRQGYTLLFLTNEYPEIAPLVDRILVLENGRVKGELNLHIYNTPQEERDG